MPAPLSVDVRDVVAIDVHVHVEVSDAGGDHPSPEAARVLGLEAT